MDIPILNQKNEPVILNIFFDSYGNLYLHTNEDCFQVNIDKNNLPIGDRGNYKILGHYNDIRTDSLLNKALDHERPNNLEEDKIVNEDVIKRYGYHNREFCFSNLKDSYKIPVYEIENEEIAALYDTSVYINENICFMSSSESHESIYEFSVCNNGTIKFNLMGSQQRTFKIKLFENMLQFES